MVTMKTGSSSRGSGAYSPTIPTTASSSSTLSDQWPSSISSSSENINSDSEKKKDGTGCRFKEGFGNEQMNISTASPPSSDIITKARPLAVVDYGSIELDMSGSLLDSIYKIGPPSAGAARKNDGGFTTTDWTRMKRHRAFPSSHHHHHEDDKLSPRSKRRNVTTTTTTETAATALHSSQIARTKKAPVPADDEVVKEEGCNSSSTDPPVHGSTHYSISSSKPNLENIASTASSGALQVQAISSASASLRSILGHRPTMHEGTTEEPTSTKRDTAIISTTKPVEAGRMLGHPLPTISKIPCTLEAAISFSPFAR
jgi:hypothetical protein